jgi:hypothetical protein
VEGGTDSDIANAIYENRGIGCYTNGNTLVPVISEMTGIETIIRFQRPTKVPIYISLSLSKLPGYSVPDTTDEIKSALCNYLNTLKIGETIIASYLWGIIQDPTYITNPYSPPQPLFSINYIHLARHEYPRVGLDIALEYDEYAYGDPQNILVSIL